MQDTPNLPHTYNTLDDKSPWKQRFDQIHTMLRRRITTLEYQPGSRLDVDELSAEFGVSRTPVRNVLQRLDAEGLVKMRHGVGTIVAPLDLVAARQAVLFRIELASMIGTLEPRNVSEENLTELRQCVVDCQQLLGRANLEAFALLDIRVHKAICRIIGNENLFQIYDELYFRTARIWFYFLPEQDWDDEILIFMKDIELTLTAMENNDAKGVGFITRNAVYNAYVRLEPIFAPPETS